MSRVLCGDTLIYMGMDFSKHVPCTIVRRDTDKVIVESNVPLRSPRNSVFEDRWFRFKMTPETRIKYAMRARSEARG
jgi:hypothetical protein